MTRRLIEQWLPASSLGVESRRERATFTALPPLFALHVWWARRPLVASRAAIVASLLPAWPTAAEASEDPSAAKALAALEQEFPNGEDEYRSWYLWSLGIFGDPVAARDAITAARAAGTTTQGNAYGYDRAFTASPDDKTVERIHRLAALCSGTDGPPTVLDPFAGGGSIPFEATRYGCSTIANELNPVATAILTGTVDLPARLSADFAGEISRWGEKWVERVRVQLEPYFPLERSDERPAFIWAHTVPCPTTGRPTPLAPDFWLARAAAGRNIAVRLDADPANGTYRLAVVEGEEAREVGPRSTYKRGAAESIWTGETFSGGYIRRMGAEGRIGQMLLAVSVTRPGRGGRQFRAPNAADLAAVDAAVAELDRQRPAWEIADLLPMETIFEGKETKRSVEMGLRRWADMFTPRQLLANVTALEELQKLTVEARSELGDERGRALALYLAFALDKAVDYNGMLSSWDATRLKVRNTFDRHDFSYKWTFAEFDGAHSLLPWTVSQIVRTYRGTATLTHREQTFRAGALDAQVQITRSPASQLGLPNASVDVIVTDPPYYDNVMYAECSDYFYVWDKRALQDTWPQFTDLPLTDKEHEAVANPSLFRDVASPGRGRRGTSGRSAMELADARYEDLLRQSFLEANRVLKDDGVMTVMFTHKRVDAWDTLGAALLNAGFSINGSWPVHTESEHSLHQAKKNAASSTIFLTCRKRTSSEPAFWSDIRRDVERAAEQAAERFAAEGLTGVDLTIATYGPVLAVLSDRWPVYTGALDENGDSVVLRPDAALDLARERVATLKMRGLLGGRLVEFDRTTDWYLLAWNDFKAIEFPFDEARKLSIATHLELDELARAHIVRQGSGTVTIQTPAQRHTAGAIDVSTPSDGTWLDRLHALMVVYDQDGLNAARAWLARTGLADQPQLNDLVEAALHAIPRTRERGAFVRPEARILDSMRSTLFSQIPLPAEEGIPLTPARQLRFDPTETDTEEASDHDEDDGDEE